jgi:hypothetical protein
LDGTIITEVKWWQEKTKDVNKNAHKWLMHRLLLKEV